MSLSNYVLELIRQLDDGGDSDLSKEQYREVRQFTDLVARGLLESRLASTDQVAVCQLEEMLARNPELLPDMFDDYYTRFIIRNVHKYVRRTKKLASLVVKTIPSDGVRLYLREATKNYVLGHWFSSIALARTALETSLRECIGLAPRADTNS
jgi:hypothetical protein